MTLGISIKCHYAECRVLHIVMLNVIVLSVVMLRAIMLKVIMMIVMAPRKISYLDCPWWGFSAKSSILGKII